jgi:glucosamine-6-phosphate deaminase
MKETKFTKNKNSVKYALQTRFERIPVIIYSDFKDAAVAVANEIAALIKIKQLEGEYCVLGLPTGSTPLSVYNELIRMHKQDGLSFSNVVVFNTDEYYPIAKDSLQSFAYVMHENLYKHIDIQKENIHLIDGSIAKDEIYKYCKAYEDKIDNYGGIDIQILGIGRTGHIGFNEPGSMNNSITRPVVLDYMTRNDVAIEFHGIENVPRKSITMGVGTILKAKKIILMAHSEQKSKIIKEMVEGEVTSKIPATFLQLHENVKVVLDNGAAEQLTRIKTPWLVDTVEWNDQLIRKSVVWLCQKVQKPILKLTDRDYNDHGMSELITEYGPAYNINIKVFNDLQRTITGWPG